MLILVWYREAAIESANFRNHHKIRFQTMRNLVCLKQNVKSTMLFKIVKIGQTK